MNDKKTEQYFTKEEENEIWENVFRQTRANDAKKRKKKKAIQYGMVSLAFLLIAGSLFLYQYFQSTIYYASADSKAVILPDQSHVELLKGAKLTVNRDFSFNNREVRLDGDAIFFVTKSQQHPFIVHGNGYVTTVHGTTFKIIQSKDSFQVDLLEGSVSVNQIQSSQHYRLKPGQTFNNYGQKTVAAIAPTADSDIGRMGDNKSNVMDEMHLINCPLQTAIPIMEKMTGSPIEIPQEFGKTLITVSLAGASAEDVLHNLAEYLRLKISKNEKGYKLSK